MMLTDCLLSYSKSSSNQLRGFGVSLWNLLDSLEVSIMIEKPWLLLLDKMISHLLGCCDILVLLRGCDELIATLNLGLNKLTQLLIWNSKIGLLLDSITMNKLRLSLVQLLLLRHWLLKGLLIEVSLIT